MRNYKGRRHNYVGLANFTLEGDFRCINTLTQSFENRVFKNTFGLARNEVETEGKT